MINLENKRELFVDYYFIENMNDTSLKLHHPVSAGVPIKYDQPLETESTCASFYTTVFQDGDIFRMYYRGDSRYVCYAESKDGINWYKPNVSLIEHGKSKNNNIILPDCQIVFSPFLDTKPGVSQDERYKANMERDCFNRDPLKKGLNFYSSADGKQFIRIQGDPAIPWTIPNHFDSQNVIFWSEAEQQYVIYARYKVGLNGKLIDHDRYLQRSLKQGEMIRSTVRATSPDFENWSEFTPMEYSDTDSITPSAQLYTNATIPYFRANHIYISLPGRIFFEKIQEPKVVRDQADVGDCSDGVLMTTRAGSTRYDFTFRESLLRPGIGDENWTTRNNYPALGLIQTNDSEISIFVQRRYAQPTAYLERMTLRLDGFASLNAGYKEGQMITKPLDFTGNKLELNYSTSAAGSIRVELLDVSGTPLDGYSLDDCDGLIGDEISGYVSWKGSTDLSKISGKPVRIRFMMNDADIYSFRFEVYGK